MNEQSNRELQLKVSVEEMLKKQGYSLKARKEIFKLYADDS